MLRAFDGAVYPALATLDLAPMTCACVDAGCNGGFPLTCGVTTGTGGLYVATVGPFAPGGGCEACGCNLRPLVELLGVAGTCLPRP